MSLTVAEARARLARQAGILEGLARGADPEQAHWKPAPERWSIVEVVNHLHDEEREDFRARLEFVLLRPGEEAPGIDPPRWAITRGYQERELEPSLEAFLRERRRSLAWLDGLGAVDLDTRYSFGPITAGELLASWVAHDLLHVRQLGKLHYDWWAQRTAPHDVAYAGNWT
jgi:hypothetical protein